MKISNPGPNIWYYENAIPEVEKFISLLNDNNDNKKIASIISRWSEWREGTPSEKSSTKWSQHGSPVGEVKSVDWDRKLNNFGNTWPKVEPKSDAHTEAYEILKLIDIPFNNVIEHYWSAHPELPKIKYVSKNYPIRKYNTNSYLGRHTDVNKHNPTMDISVLIYLNDEYVGGEIYFNDLDLKIKPTPGSVLLFPPDYLHESLPIESGNKLYIPMFIHSEYGTVTAFAEEYSGMLLIIKNNGL